MNSNKDNSIRVKAKVKDKTGINLTRTVSSSTSRLLTADQPVKAKIIIRGARLQPFSRAEDVRRKVGFTQQEIADFLGIDPRTYNRRAEEERLKSGESLLVEMIDKVLEEATRVFRDEVLARKWLTSPIISLDNSRPIDHLDSIEGYERVKDTLGKIEYGMY